MEIHHPESCSCEGRHIENGQDELFALEVQAEMYGADGADGALDAIDALDRTLLHSGAVE